MNGNFSENCLNSVVIVDNHWVGSVLITGNIIEVTLGELQTGLKLIICSSFENLGGTIGSEKG